MSSRLREAQAKTAKSDRRYHLWDRLLIATVIVNVVIAAWDAVGARYQVALYLLGLSLVTLGVQQYLRRDHRQWCVLMEKVDDETGGAS